MFEKVRKTDDVKKVVDFEGKGSALFVREKYIPEVQTQGVTALCKILNKRQYAYLADEVGMGKTFQACGVIAMLLAEKPNAHILVVAPNQNVQNNWAKEIASFNGHNLVFKDKIIRSATMHPLDLVGQGSMDGVSTVSVIRLTALSYIGQNVARRSGEPNVLNNNGDIVKNALSGGLKSLTGQAPSLKESAYGTREAGILCGDFLRDYSPKFDLVVIDEAQNIKNENNATTFLSNWLGLRRFREGKPQTQTKFLLMSATPAHRGVESLKDQLRYFEEDPVVNREALQEFLIRRLRTYCGENRYSVRQITAGDVVENASVDQCMFLALIQSRLAHLQRANNSTFKIGFLETFESYTASAPQTQGDEESDEVNKEFDNSDANGKDEKGSAADKKMLTEIAASYAKKFGDACPPHPKLNYMEKEIGVIKQEIDSAFDDSEFPNKALVFVRRIASVQELVFTRLGKKYEDEIVRYWSIKLGMEKNESLLSIKKRFEELYNGVLKGKKDGEDENSEYSIAEEDESSEVEFGELRAWMKQQKSDKNRQYSAVSRFKKSLTKNRTNSYLFDENYLYTAIVKNGETGDYEAEVKKLVTEEFAEKVSCYVAADKGRYSFNAKPKRSDLLSLYCYVALKECGDPVAGAMQRFYNFVEPVSDQKVENYIACADICKILLQESIWNALPPELSEPFNQLFTGETFTKREAIKSWIEKYLKQSEAVLEMLYAYCADDDSETRCKAISKSIFNRSISHCWRIRQLLNNYEYVCRQFEKLDEINYKYDPKFMNNQEWVVGAVGGDRSNGDKILRFNTPFYPDVIVCTDVFKEGIDLHLFCNRVYHYGLAWTPGDLEQRVGRVDRFFSKTHRARMNGKKDAFIHVTYPYMGKSIDEQQLKKVLRFKVSADPLMDSTSEQKNIDSDFLESATVRELVEYKPEENLQTNAPYSGENILKEE